MLTPSMHGEMGRIRAASLRDDARDGRRGWAMRRRRNSIRAALGARLVSAGFRMLRGVT